MNRREHSRYKVAGLSQLEAQIDRGCTGEKIITVSLGGCGFYGLEPNPNLRPGKILNSLTEVVHASLAKEKSPDNVDLNVIWTTQKGFNQIQERIKHIGTVEIVDVAKEIEAARALAEFQSSFDTAKPIEAVACSNSFFRCQNNSHSFEV